MTTGRQTAASIAGGAQPTRMRFEALLWLAVILVIPLVFGVISVLLGKDVNWDLRNYHYYNAYALLHNRLDVDVAPAQLQTFYNPLGDIPFYWITRVFPPQAAGLGLGVLHGFNFSLIFLIFWNLSNQSRRGAKFLLGFGVALISSIAPGFVSELGATMNDNVTSLFVLAALLLLIHHVRDIARDMTSSARMRLVAAGFIIGFGAGLKATIVIYVLACALAVAIAQSTLRNRVTALFLYGSAALMGALLSSGYWWWELWSRYGNPYFPIYNNIFRSPLVEPIGFAYTMAPRQFWEFLAWPFIFSADSYRVNQIRFMDVRFALLYIVCLLWMGSSLWRSLKARGSLQGPGAYPFERASANFVLLFMVAGYVLWVLQTSIYRYIIPLELLVPICFLLIVPRVSDNRGAQLAVILVALGLTLAFFRPFSWGRAPWDRHYFSVNVRPFRSTDSALVVMLGWSPMSYVIPEFPPSYRFVRPEGNLVRSETDGLFQEVKQIVARSDTPIYVLYDRNDPDVDPANSSIQLGISIETATCSLLRVDPPDTLELCRAIKASETP